MNLDKHNLMIPEVSRIIEMAWEDRTPFEAIHREYGFSESQTINLMRANLHLRAFKNWRARVAGRKTKHQKIRNPSVSRGYCTSQYKVRSGK
ncbi:MAG: TIGR03643 family protein [Alteromonadaceae bacterium]|jgi:uncharacterized protein (TIGR03643 family)|nr:TIGR03643 family protein [Alteromonadaceae bacterium]MBB18851.1 TIGR03643 family protein [Rickettsiales bacterium]